MLAQEIRSKFYDFFQRHDHQKLPSSSLIPLNDPTLLFANAGMNQFKDFFTGKAVPENKRAVTIQKCVRAGGKHNDLENVGFTARHHTFFEMLGNFSFGDYFKKEAISFAWEFLTQDLNISPDKLFITVHHSDDEAFNIWNHEIGVPAEKIYRLGDKSNFWEMGETGPCGPCSEIFYDHGASFSTGVPEGHQEIDDEGRYVEIWNLVFMQYEKFRNEHNVIQTKSLPNPSVDTGAGLERLAAILQGKYYNYDSDIFSPILKTLGQMTGYDYESSSEEIKSSFRVVADHIRSSTMLITDGVIPSNEGRGYVLRRIIRRAIRHLSLLGQKETCFYKLIPSLFETLAEEYLDNAKNAPLAEKLLKLEEDKFRKTLENGLGLIQEEILHLKKGEKLSGKVAFKLYDTFGFPLDLTEIILKEKNLELHHEEFEREMEKQKALSKKSSSFKTKEDNLKLFYQLKEKWGATEFLGYQETSLDAKLLAKEEIDDRTYLIFDRTPFYAESGGQEGDQGFVSLGNVTLATIEDTQKPVDDLHVHMTANADSLEVGQIYKISIQTNQREFIKKNHSATHLLQAALIKTLGPHIKQSGSSVGPERLRFDFTHSEPLSEKEIEGVENLVNEAISQALPVQALNTTKTKAQEMGAMALFGEKYGDVVRVLKMGNFSLELCGGTHVENTREIELFKIITETSLASGVRRIEAITSQTAKNYLFHRSKLLKELEKEFSSKEEKALEKVQQLILDNKEKTKMINSLQDKIQQSESEKMFLNPETLSNGLLFFNVKASSQDQTDLRKLADIFVEKHPQGVLFLFSVDGERASFILKTHRQNKNLNLSSLVKVILSKVGGKGGGKPDHLQGSLPSQGVKEFVNLLEKELSTVQDHS